MASIRKTTLPEQALLQKYNKDSESYTDCYVVDVTGQINLTDYVHCFYTGRLFRLERWLLAIAVKLGSSDAQLADMLNGKIDKFSAWTVEGRADRQLLLCDYQKRTRSWFMAEPVTGGTMLYFGSAVVQASNRKPKECAAPLIFKALMPFHKLYSRLLLGSAARRIQRSVRSHSH